MAGPKLDYEIDPIGSDIFSNAMGWADQGRKMAIQRQMDNYALGREGENRSMEKNSFAERRDASKMQAKNDLMRQQFANQNLSQYIDPQMQAEDRSRSSAISQQMTADGQPQNPGQSSNPTAKKGTIENPFAPNEYHKFRDAIGDTSTIHWQRDADGNLYGVSGSGIVSTGIQADPLEGHLKKYDAKRIAEYDDIAANAQQTQVTLDEISNIISSPEFSDVRSNDYIGELELKWYETNGTPAQKEMIGELRTYMGNIVKDASRDFKGTFRTGEQALLNSMKPNPRDTISAMKGKMGALSYLNQILMKRADLESRFMREEGMSYSDAKMAADQIINPEEIKKGVNDNLHPENNSFGGYSMEDLEYTAKQNGMTIDQLLKELGV